MRDGGNQKRGDFGAEVVPFLRRLLKRAFFSWRTSSSERPGAVKGAPLLGAAQRTLDGEDRSKMIKERKRRGEKLTKSAGAKVAPSLGATDTISFGEAPEHTPWAIQREDRPAAFGRALLLTVSLGIGYPFSYTGEYPIPLGRCFSPTRATQ